MANETPIVCTSCDGKGHVGPEQDMNPCDCPLGEKWDADGFIGECPDCEDDGLVLVMVSEDEEAERYCECSAGRDQAGAAEAAADEYDDDCDRWGRRANRGDREYDSFDKDERGQEEWY